MFLQGLKVLDVGSYVAAPAAATVMGDFGANVIKVEPPSGDPYRELLGLIVTEYPTSRTFKPCRNIRTLLLHVVQTLNLMPDRAMPPPMPMGVPSARQQLDPVSRAPSKEIIPIPAPTMGCLTTG